MGSGAGFFFRAAFFTPRFAGARFPFLFFVGHFMFKHSTHGARPFMMTLITGCPHALHRSSVGTIRPRCGSGHEVSQSGELAHPTKRLPYVPWRVRSSPG